MFVIIIDPMLTAMYNSIDFNKVTKRLCTQFLNIGCFKQELSRAHVAGRAQPTSDRPPATMADALSAIAHVAELKAQIGVGDDGDDGALAQQVRGFMEETGASEAKALRACTLVVEKSVREQAKRDAKAPVWSPPGWRFHTKDGSSV